MNERSLTDVSGREVIEVASSTRDFTLGVNRRLVHETLNSLDVLPATFFRHRTPEPIVSIRLTETGPARFLPFPAIDDVLRSAS